jgi:hypothetical protein
MILFITMQTVVIYMFVSIVLIIGLLVYRNLLRKIKKEGVSLVDYCVLYSFEKDVQTGEIEFYFTNEKKKTVLFQILSESLEVIHTLTEKEFNPGGHILRFDSKLLKNGIYYYQLKTENQETKKRMTISNN